MPGLKVRAKTLNELLDGASFIFAERPLTLDSKAEQILARGGRAHLPLLIDRLGKLEEWNAGATEDVVREAAAEVGAKLGDLAQPLRATLTGRTTSPGIFDVLAILGREESLARLSDQAPPPAS
jgi:glutamyl-tRNA synthetase